MNYNEKRSMLIRVTAAVCAVLLLGSVFVGIFQGL